MKNMLMWIVFGIIGFVDAIIVSHVYDGPEWAAYTILSITLLFPLYAELRNKEDG